MTTDGGRPATLAMLPPPPASPEIVTPVASWFPRVIATFLDQLLLTGLTWLTFPGSAVDPPSPPVYLPAAPQTTGPTWTDSGVVVMAVVALLLMQAYLGVTPGKLVVGVAVVRDTDRRPVGLVRTVVRTVAHLLDAILLIGFLRPLWHRERRTFADSLAGTLVLRTGRPRPYRPTRRRPTGPPDAWQAATAPRWRTPVRWASAALCVLTGLAAVLPRTTDAPPPSADAWCRIPVGDVDDEAFTFTGGSVDVHDGVEPFPGPGARASGEPGVVVQWDWVGTLGDAAAIPVTVSFANDDGSPSWTSEYLLRGSGMSGGEGERLPDGSHGVRLPLSVLDGAGDSWIFTVTATPDGATGEVQQCSAAVGPPT